MFKFITNKPFWVNLVAAIVLALLLVFIFVKMLGWITHHGEHLTVPDVNGKETQEAIKLLQSQGFDVTIEDSVYTDTLPAGTVIKQLPNPNSTVKVNRTVFITVNCQVPPMIEMPELKGKNLDFALELLKKGHLQLEDTIYRRDFMKNFVLDQQYNGKPIAAGAKIRWGSAVTLIIGSGLADQQMQVPQLIGMTFGEAKDYLDSLGIAVGALVPYNNSIIDDTDAAFIVKQDPARYDDRNQAVFIKSGQLMDLWLSPVMVNPGDSLTNKMNKTQ